MGAQGAWTRVTGTTLDTGALVALERGDPRVRMLVRWATERRVPIAIPAAVVAQAWRDGRRQVQLVRLIKASATEVVPLDRRQATRIGEMCARTGSADVVDASVVICARERKQRVVTSDPDDIRALDPRVEILPLG